MPVWSYRCELCGHLDDYNVLIAQRNEFQVCTAIGCGGETSRRVFDLAAHVLKAHVPLSQGRLNGIKLTQQLDRIRRKAEAKGDKETSAEAKRELKRYQNSTD